MCMSAIMPKPKMPEIKDPKLPRQPIRDQKAANFKNENAQIGFGQTGRSGGRGLRIKRPGSGTAAFGNVGNSGGSAGPVSIGAQVPR